MELKSRSFTSKEPHLAREPQVADPWFSLKVLSILEEFRYFLIFEAVSEIDVSDDYWWEVNFWESTTIWSKKSAIRGEFDDFLWNNNLFTHANFTFNEHQP